MRNYLFGFFALVFVISIDHINTNNNERETMLRYVVRCALVGSNGPSIVSQSSSAGAVRVAHGCFYSTTTTTATAPSSTTPEPQPQHVVLRKSVVPGGFLFDHVTPIEALQSPVVSPRASKPWRALSDAEKAEIAELRRADPVSWTLRALSEKFNCAKGVISKVAPLDDATRASVFNATRPPRTKDVRREKQLRRPHPTKF